MDWDLVLNDPRIHDPVVARVDEGGLAESWPETHDDTAAQLAGRSLVIEPGLCRK